MIQVQSDVAQPTMVPEFAEFRLLPNLWRIQGEKLPYGVCFGVDCRYINIYPFRHSNSRKERSLNPFPSQVTDLSGIDQLWQNAYHWHWEVLSTSVLSTTC